MQCVTKRLYIYVYAHLRSYINDNFIGHNEAIFNGIAWADNLKTVNIVVYIHTLPTAHQRFLGSESCAASEFGQRIV